ncbi:MAG: flagellar FlbD family protein [Gemmatimonadetes bacterium]|nr:flagellar FlbD family protein [Gemmatimonadota bacterium]
MPGHKLIKLTRRERDGRGRPLSESIDIHVNPAHIIKVERGRQTLVTLSDGSRLMVTETPERIALIIEAGTESCDQSS